MDSLERFSPGVPRSSSSPSPNGLLDNATRDCRSCPRGPDDLPKRWPAAAEVSIVRRPIDAAVNDRFILVRISSEQELHPWLTEHHVRPHPFRLVTFRKALPRR